MCIKFASNLHHQISANLALIAVFFSYIGTDIAHYIHPQIALKKLQFLHDFFIMIQKLHQIQCKFVTYTAK